MDGNKIKQLKSNYLDLRGLFRSMSVEHVLEELKCCRADDDAANIRDHMGEDNLDFDVMGLEDKGKVYGYVERESLGSGPCRNYQKTFHPSELISKSTPLTDLFPLLRNAPRMFVLDGNRVMGIVTRGDLQKAPVRMLLFGFITLIEMNLLRLIRTRHPNDSWITSLSDNRVNKARELHANRKAKNEALDLAECLQLCDKSKLILRIPVVQHRIESEFGKSGDRFLASLEKLRDKLAHAQDIVLGTTWVEIADLAMDIIQLLQLVESM